MGRGWGWSAVWAGVLPALGSEPKLTMRFPNALADPTPVQVEVSPSAEAKTDYLEGRAHSVVYRLPVPRTPNAPTRREWLCYTLMLQRGWRFQPSFSWREAGIPKPLKGASLPHLGVVIVGNLSGGYEFLESLTLQWLKEPIIFQGKRVPPPSQDVPVTFLNHARSEPIATVGNRVLAARIPYGYGQLIVFGGDLTHPAWRSWQAHPTLWQTFLQQVRLPLLRLSDVQQLPNQAPPAEPTQRYMHVALAAVVLAVYLCALYALWRILRLHRKLVFAPIGVAALSGMGVVALFLVVPPKQVHTSLIGKRVILCVGDRAVEYSVWSYRSPAGEWRLNWQPVDALAVEPIVVLNPTVVEFTNQGARLSGGSLAPTIVNIHTLTQKPAPLRVRKSLRGYELVNTSDNLTFEQLYIGRYKSPSRSRPARDTQTQEHLWAWQLLTPSPLAPAQSIPFPRAPTEGCAVRAFAHRYNAAQSEEVEVWLFLP